MVTILSRDQWDAASPRSRDTNFTKTGGIVIHHTGTTAASIVSHYPDCYRRWRAHQYYHMNNKGWTDLAYNFGVCPHAFVFEGRGWDAQNGANTPENSSTLSICVDVNSDVDTFDAQVVVAVNEMISQAVDRGWAARLRGHFEVSTTGTGCPGANLKLLLADGEIHLPATEEPGAVPLLGGDLPILTMQDWARSKNGTELYVSLASPARSISLEYGVNPAVTYAIMGHETRFGRFGGVLDETFRNWGGIKTSSGGSNDDPSAHARFVTHTTGVRAVAQHVAGYAGVKIPTESIVDPRFYLLAGKRISHLPSDEWTWASSEHDSNVVRYVKEMV